MKHEVVVFDPAGSLPEGKVFQQDLRLGEAKRRGVVTLQVDAQLRKVALSPWANPPTGLWIIRKALAGIAIFPAHATTEAMLAQIPRTSHVTVFPLAFSAL